MRGSRAKAVRLSALCSRSWRRQPPCPLCHCSFTAHPEQSIEPLHAPIDGSGAVSLTPVLPDLTSAFAQFRRVLLLTGEPVYPAATYVVVPVMAGKAAAMRGFVGQPVAQIGSLRFVDPSFTKIQRLGGTNQRNYDARTLGSRQRLQ